MEGREALGFGRRCRIYQGTSIEQEPVGTSKGILRVTGVIRGGAPLDVNRLVHVVGVGDFQVEKVRFKFI